MVNVGPPPKVRRRVRPFESALDVRKTQPFCLKSRVPPVPTTINVPSQDPSSVDVSVSVLDVSQRTSEIDFCLDTDPLFLIYSSGSFLRTPSSFVLLGVSSVSLIKHKGVRWHLSRGLSTP